MALVLDSPTRDEILKLSNNPMPVLVLNKMSFDELETMNHQIGKIVEEEFLEKSLYEQLMQLRARIVLTMWSS
jgi:hypothetical protein